jgi:hypothetical protein
MDGVERFRQWAARAREERRAAPDVTGRVLRTLAQTRHEEASRDWLLGWQFKAALVAATALLALLGLKVLGGAPDPYQEWVGVFLDWWQV